MKYLIDTHIGIYIMNQHPPGVISKFKKFEVGDIGVSSITVAELQYGVEKNGPPRMNQGRLDAFLAPFDIVGFDQSAANAYGRIRIQLEMRGLPIGPLDLLIAAQALAGELVLVTNNEKEFKRISGLRVQNWAD